MAEPLRRNASILSSRHFLLEANSAAGISISQIALLVVVHVYRLGRI